MAYVLFSLSKGVHDRSYVAEAAQAGAQGEVLGAVQSLLPDVQPRNYRAVPADPDRQLQLVKERGETDDDDT